MHIFIIFLLKLLIINNFVEAAKILSVFPYPGPSQYIFGSALLKGLAEKGHEITSVSTFPQKKPLKNFHDLTVMENLNLFDDLMIEVAEAKSDKTFFDEFIKLAAIGEIATSNIFENSQVQNIMAKGKFDLIIVEIFNSEALLGFGEHFQVPVIAVSTFGTISFMDYLVGNPSPLSYIPHMGLPYGNHMSLRERIVNVLMNIADLLCLNYIMLTYQERVYEKYFPNAVKTLDDLRKNVSLVLLNNHFTLNFPRPYVTNMIEVGGLHIKEKPDPLPLNLQKYLDEATNGAIYFSMGSNVKSKDLPPEKLKIFLETFGELNVKVLWKFELEDLPNKPHNVFIQKWCPQPSVLTHRNVKIFISHGGFLSTTETIFHAKPILGIPIIGDQFMNVKNAIRAGYALSLQLKDITKDSFKSSILELLNNPKYTENVQHLSKLYRDQPMTPMDTAIYWVEYVIRHKGALHIRNPGMHLNFWQYHNIDVFSILFVIFGVVTYLLGWMVRKLFSYRNRMSRSGKMKVN